MSHINNSVRTIDVAFVFHTPMRLAELVTVSEDSVIRKDMFAPIFKNIPHFRLALEIATFRFSTANYIEIPFLSTPLDIAFGCRVVTVLVDIVWPIVPCVRNSETARIEAADTLATMATTEIVEEMETTAAGEEDTQEETTVGDVEIVNDFLMQDSNTEAEDSTESSATTQDEVSSVLVLRPEQGFRFFSAGLPRAYSLDLEQKMQKIVAEIVVNNREAKDFLILLRNGSKVWANEDDIRDVDHDNLLERFETELTRKDKKTRDTQKRRRAQSLHKVANNAAAAEKEAARKRLQPHNDKAPKLNIEPEDGLFSTRSKKARQKAGIACSATTQFAIGERIKKLKTKFGIDESMAWTPALQYMNRQLDLLNTGTFPEQILAIENAIGLEKECTAKKCLNNI